VNEAVLNLVSWLRGRPVRACGPWSVVRGAGACGRADGPQIGVQPRGELIDQRLELRSIRFGKQLAEVGPAKEVPGLVQRSAGDADVATIVLQTSPSGAFRDIGPDVVGRPYQLPAKRFFRQGIPSDYQDPDAISDLFRQAVDSKTLEIGFSRHEMQPIQVGQRNRRLNGRPKTCVAPGH